MKKILMTLILVLTCLVTTNAQAADSPAFSTFNLQADTLYLPTTGQFAVGVGYTVATYKSLELRAETAYIANATEGEKRSFFGAGVGVNIKDLVTRAGGTWAMSSISPTVGVLGLFDATAQKKLLPAIYVSLIKVEF